MIIPGEKLRILELNAPIRRDYNFGREFTSCGTYRILDCCSVCSSVILYHPWWSYTSPLHKPTGYREMKIRHLEALGYNVISVDQIDTQNLTFVQKIKMLRDRLFFEKYDSRTGAPPELSKDSLTSTVNFSALPERKVSIRDFM